MAEFCEAVTTTVVLALGDHARSALADPVVEHARHGDYTRFYVSESVVRTDGARVVFAPVPKNGRLEWTVKVRDHNHITCNIGICSTYTADSKLSENEARIRVYAQGVIDIRGGLDKGGIRTNGKYGPGDKLTCILDLSLGSFSILRDSEPYVEFAPFASDELLHHSEWCPLLYLHKSTAQRMLNGETSLAEQDVFDVAFGEVTFPFREAQQQAIDRFNRASRLHVLSTRYHGVSFEVAAQVKRLLETQEGVACFNPNTDNAVIAGQDKSQANAVWLKRWRQMLKQAATREQQGVVIQMHYEPEGLSEMQDAEQEMAEDKAVQVVRVPFAAPLSDKQMRSLLQAGGLLS